MGIAGLTSYVNSLGNLVWEDCDLSKFDALVIDGNGLCYRLYITNNLCCRYGGQYSELSKVTEKFFFKLSSNGVRPYVVFDGISDESNKKMATVLTRKSKLVVSAGKLWKDGGNTMVLPMLCRETVIRTLKKLKVQYAVADFEADREIASLANGLCAPVMGNDSDFFIYNINHGYIPFNKYEGEGANMVASRFQCSKLAKHLNISISMLPMFASLMGNDYVPKNFFDIAGPYKQFIKKQNGNQFQRVAKYLSGKQSNQQVIAAMCFGLSADNAKKVTDAISLSLEEYEFTSTHLHGYFEHGSLDNDLMTYNDTKLPEWLVKIHRSEVFGDCISCLARRCVLPKIQVENSLAPCSSISVLDVRHKLFKLLVDFDNEGRCVESTKGKMFIEQYERRKSVLITRKTDLNGLLVDLKMTGIPTMKKREAATHISVLLSCDIAQFEDLPIDWQLVAMALRFWLSQAVPMVKYEYLITLIEYLTEQEGSPQSRHPGCQPFHAFAQWQQVIYWVNTLNILFLKPFPALDPAKVYNGIILNTYHAGVESARNKNAKLFDELFTTVTDGLRKDCVFFATSKKPTGPRKRPKTGTESASLERNRFELLRLSSASDEDS